MDEQTKKNDENYIQYTVSDVRNCDSGYSVYFTDSPLLPGSRIGERLTYWLDSKFGFMPRPGDVFRLYGVMSTKNAETVYGLDIIRFEKDGIEEKPQRVRTEIFYNEELKDKLAPKKEKKKDTEK